MNWLVRARRVLAAASAAWGGSYIGARQDRRQTLSWRVWPGDPDDDTLPDLPVLRARSRDLVRNEPLACGAIETVVNGAVGSGLSLLPQPDWQALGLSEPQALEWKERVQREFRAWSESFSCDVTRATDFYGLQRLALRSWLESGDVFVILRALDRQPYSLALQVVEADRVASPPGGNQERIRGGVEVDEDTGEAIGYWISRKHPGSFSTLGAADFVRVEAFGRQSQRRLVLHLMERLRPGQTRGVPFLAPVIEDMMMLGRYIGAELGAAVVSSMFAVFIRSENPGAFGAEERAGAPVMRLEPMTMTELRPGEDLTTIKSDRPNQSFDPFVQAILRRIGVGLGLPFEVLIKHFTASYSAARAALLEAWKFFRYRRELLAAQFCQPVYDAWLTEAVASGRIEARGFLSDPAARAAWSAAEWQGDAMAHIDPGREAAAAETRLRIGITSRAAETMQLTGREYADVHRELVREQQMRLAAGLNGGGGGGGQSNDDEDGEEE